MLPQITLYYVPLQWNVIKIDWDYVGNDVRNDFEWRQEHLCTNLTLTALLIQIRLAVDQNRNQHKLGWMLRNEYFLFSIIK